MKAEGFLNPYTFVPAFPREGLPKQLQDSPPPSRDRLHPERWSGRIEVALTTETPLLLPDPARSQPPSSGEEGHEVYPVRLRDGRPHLGSTAVKGMLRSAFEAVTNSRFGVFSGHDAPLGFRRDAGYALKLVPVYVAGKGVLYRFETALLEMYDDQGNQLLARPPGHMQRLRAIIKRGDQNRMKVVDFVPDSAARVLQPGPGEHLVNGIAYVTGPTVEKKRFERFFYKGPEKPEQLKPARPWEEIAADWDILMSNYKSAHSTAELHERSTAEGRIAKPGERIGDGPGQLAWSPHIHDADHQKLGVGTLCYARLNEDREVERLYPVLIPRDVYSVSPADLLGPSLAPAPTYADMSPADRLFGWVAPNGRSVRPAAYRGRLRVSPVVCTDDSDKAIQTFPADGLPLAILSAPKPQQGRFYVAESAARPDQPIKDGTRKADIYRPGRGLRGRKVYWHHAGLDAEQHWKLPSADADAAQLRAGERYREYVRSRTPVDDSAPLTPDKRRFATTHPEQRDSQNRSISGWVRPGTTFRFTVEVRDVDECELGALAWLLALPAGHFHRLGFGRPLGFGSVRLNIEHAELHKGSDYRAHYRSLSGILPDRDWHAIVNTAIETFNTLVGASPALKTVREAMLAVSRGVPTLPVHYPRVRRIDLHHTAPTPPDPRGLQYKWFTANEQLQGETSARGRGRSLPRPAGTEPPLEIYSDEDKSTSPSNGARKQKWRQNGKSMRRDGRNQNGRRQS
ncbi:TIGR03986 family type III CRISPR-associated RAMP protein [Nonomuraea angiospora]|uniref:TIGR03986 family type III CRISPR-associated RAMP protein n=1 Tax=Nonomuraea angiospora TaxID=46172 RepID=UPI0029BACB00|nr:TIGR03986 family CRISPR-associated RAMP protein [Nonomuraea angiospora]MDX3099974.1 TIGR03986 family CRISPR-associated RAMP protein [Nonomuraea angiospora]